MLDGHESHINAEFDEYYKANKIIPLIYLLIRYILPSPSINLLK